MKKADLSTVTLCMFDGAARAEAAEAMEIALGLCTVHDAVWLAPERPPAWFFEQAPFARYIQIPRMDYAQAMRFQARVLGEFIDADASHMLSLEWDGFPINPHLWSPDFLACDYIGAPWPSIFIPDHVRAALGDGSLVGNGGCCLRSRWFIQALRAAPDHDGRQPGDCYWCQHPGVRDLMARVGATYADLQTAMEFAFENPLPEIPVWSVRQSFGFHGPHWRPDALRIARDNLALIETRNHEAA